MDLEGFAKRGLLRGDPDLEERLVEMIVEVKGDRITRSYAKKLAEAVLVEARSTLSPEGDVFDLSVAGVTMGDFGVGSRGLGDFYAHEKIAEVIGETDAVVDSRQLDDSGAVEAGGRYIVLTVDGMHSRLSDYPFLAGFHVTRATLRDIYVMRARPVAMFSDIHLADDGDVSRLKGSLSRFDGCLRRINGGLGSEHPCFSGVVLRPRDESLLDELLEPLVLPPGIIAFGLQVGAGFIL